MNKEKLIKEMGRDIGDILLRYINLEPYQYNSIEYSEKYRDMKIRVDIPSIINALYNAGYRKQSEVARAIFKELDYYTALYKKGDFSDKSFLEYIAEIKKKYTEENR